MADDTVSRLRTDDSPFDIDTTASEDGAWCVLVHPATGQPLAWGGKPVRVLMAGPDGARFRRACRQAAREAPPPDADEAALAEAEIAVECRLLAALTLGWENLHRPDGAVLDLSAEAARALYAERPWLRAQLARFVGDRANFVTASRNG